jgi:hypothetical protein
LPTLLCKKQRPLDDSEHSDSESELREVLDDAEDHGMQLQIEEACHEGIEAYFRRILQRPEDHTLIRIDAAESHDMRDQFKDSGPTHRRATTQKVTGKLRQRLMKCDETLIEPFVREQERFDGRRGLHDLWNEKRKQIEGLKNDPRPRKRSAHDWRSA